MTQTEFCGHESCDMEPCSMTYIDRHALHVSGNELTTEASEAGLRVGSWPSEVAVESRDGTDEVLFERATIEYDDDGDLMLAEYTNRERGLTLTIFND